MKDDVKWGEERFPLKIGNFPALNGARAKISLYSVFPFKILNSLQAGEMCGSEQELVNPRLLVTPRTKVE